MSDTPRVDALTSRHAEPSLMFGPRESYDEMCYLARQLERELAQAYERAAQVCDKLNFIDNGMPGGIRANNRHCAAAIRALKTPFTVQ